MRSQRPYRSSLNWGDLRRFDYPNQINAYIGIDLRHYESGQYTLPILLVSGVMPWHGKSCTDPSGLLLPSPAIIPITLMIITNAKSNPPAPVPRRLPLRRYID
ncbi:transposase [Sporolactobacillus pectinivorans]|uniref:transposase n=1 Tax=Sporolactobacillus pectinivorans TaxID=1591408 RepID=UPI0030B80FE7